MAHSFRNSRFYFLGPILGSMAMLFTSGSARGAALSWAGPSATDTWAIATQWTEATAPILTGAGAGADTMTFGATGNTSVLLTDADQQDQVKSIVFAAGAQAYTFSRPNYPTKDVWVTSSATNNGGSVSNNSAFTQTFNSGLHLGYSSSTTNVSLNATTADIQINDHLALSGRSQTSSSTNGLKINGPFKVNVTGDLTEIGNVVAFINTELNVSGSWINATTTTSNYLMKVGTGTLVLNGPSTTVALLYIGTGNSSTRYSGTVRIRDSAALGPVGGTGEVGDSNTLIYGGSGNGGNARLELDNDITCSESIVFYGRPDSNQAAGIANFNGNNTLNGALTLATSGGDQHGFESVAAGKKLTIQSALGFILGTNTQTLNFRGAGDFDLAGGVSAPSAGPAVVINKYGAGTMTVSVSVDLNAHATYYGGIVVNEGVMKPGDGVTFTNTNFFVASGASIDASAVSGGLFLSGQKLGGGGTVNGAVSAMSSTLAPGNTAVYSSTVGKTFTPTAGTLNLVGDLAFDGSALESDLANVTTVGSDVNDLVSVTGNIAMSGIGTINVNRLNGVLVTGDYVLMQCTGTRTGSIAGWTINGLPDTSGSRQVFSLGANATQLLLQVSGSAKSLTWSGNGTTNVWDVYNSISNPGAALNWDSNTEKFYNGDLVTFGDTGSRTPPVDIVGDVLPASITVDNSLGNDYTFAGSGGILGGPALTKNGAGKLTIANSAVSNAIGTVTVNGGTVAFANTATNSLGNLVLNAGTLSFNLPVDATLTNVVTGTAGNLQQDGSTLLTLNLSAAGYTGTITATNGTLRTASLASSGVTGIYINGTGALDLNQVNPGVPIFVEGPGFDPTKGALYNIIPTATGGITLASVTMTGDTAMSGVGVNGTRTMIAISSLHANHHKLTKLGKSIVDIGNSGADTETGLGEIDILEGRLYIGGSGATLGDTDKAVTIYNYAYLGLDSLVPVTHNKPIIIDKTGGRIQSYAAGTTSFNGGVSFNGALSDATMLYVDTEVAGSNVVFLDPIVGHGGFWAYGDPATKVVLSDANTYDGPTLVGNINYAAGFTLELTEFGQISAASQIEIVPAGNFNVTGAGTHTLGTIIGSADNAFTTFGPYGAMNVFDASVVTATSITVNSLSIGGSSAAAAAAVPEPGTWLLLLAGAIGLGVYRRIRNRS
ncbi:MAG: PEP-CTERM sorting domain-containing protein [Pirellulales bacterium]|nr:PEP-CTERM sorting domain-containing protein [Pirellulales bacterium]